MEKSNILNTLKEVARDLLKILFVLFILVFPFALVWLCMYIEQITLLIQ